MQFDRHSKLGMTVCVAVWVVFCAGCKQAPELPTMLSPYKIDVQQGNVITQEMLSKLKSGMTPAQVRFVLGSPLVVDPFRTNRWDYVSTFQSQGKEVERRRVTIIFADEKLARIEGDVVVAGSDKAVPATQKPATEGAPAEAKKADPANKDAANEQQQPGFFSRMLNKLGF